MVASDKVLLETTVGDIEVELWSREAPKACRNFVQGTNSIKKSWLELWLQISFMILLQVQGDRAACAKPPVDFKTKVPRQWEVLHKLLAHPVLTTQL